MRAKVPCMLMLRTGQRTLACFSRVAQRVIPIVLRQPARTNDTVDVEYFVSTAPWRFRAT